jgi:arylsulfatase A-like enzyme
MYEHTINVPLVIRGPGFPAGKICNAQCYLRDLVPTCLELAGIEVPASVEAASLMPAVRGEIDEIHRFIIGYFADKQRMIRMHDWKYIYYPQIQREQLFFLANDPFELKDLSRDRRTVHVRDELRREMIQWLQNHGDPIEYGNAEK